MLEPRQHEIALRGRDLRLEGSLDQHQPAHPIGMEQRLFGRHQAAQRMSDQDDRPVGGVADRLVERRGRLLERERRRHRLEPVTRQLHEDDTMMAREDARRRKPVLHLAAETVHQDDGRAVTEGVIGGHAGRPQALAPHDDHHRQHDQDEQPSSRQAPSLRGPEDRGAKGLSAASDEGCRRGQRAAVFVASTWCAKPEISAASVSGRSVATITPQSGMWRSVNGAVTAS